MTKLTIKLDNTLLSVLIGAVAESSTWRPQPVQLHTVAGQWPDLAMQSLLDQWAIKMQSKMWLEDRAEYRVKFDFVMALALRWLLARYEFRDPWVDVVTADLVGDLDKFILENARSPFQRKSSKLSAEVR